MIPIGAIVAHKYRITALIGTGGMAHVYHAENIVSHHSVAIKVLKDEYLDNPEFLRRFEGEARAVLHLSHDNIVRAYGVGEYDNLPFIILEYVEGITLKELIQTNAPMPPRVAVSIIAQILDALGEAHNCGIIHRDVKPQNVIVSPNGRAKLADFGIAREATATTMTFAGSTILGSVHYLSPEQAKGVPVTTASDLYSAGIILYEMLTGTVPFFGDNSVTVALKHLNDTPIQPITINPRIPRSLNDVIMKALEKDAGHRYNSAKAMKRDLYRALNDPDGSFLHSASQASRRTNTEAATLLPKKKSHNRSLAGIGIVVTVMIVGLIFTFFAVRSRLGGNGGSEIVPALTNRLYSAAEEKANNFDFSLEIEDYESNESIPYGYVITQTPDSGVTLKRGSTIKVIVSLGPATPTVPDLLGKTRDEAITELNAVGLQLGNVSYSVSDLDIGYVCQQLPSSATEVTLGSTVDIVISASSDELVEMPVLTEDPFADALRSLWRDSFSTIYVRYDPSSKAESGIVLTQSPEVGSIVSPDVAVLITLAGMQPSAYCADVAYNLDIPANKTAVLVTVVESLNGASYERVLYETTLDRGEKLPVSFTAYSDIDGTRELIVYIGGKIVKRQDASFLAKEP